MPDLTTEAGVQGVHVGTSSAYAYTYQECMKPLMEEYVLPYLQCNILFRFHIMHVILSNCVKW